MFRHMESTMCSFSPCMNSMCQFRHEIHIETLAEEIEEAVEQTEVNWKQCHLCYTFLDLEDNLVYHMEANHIQYFDGMMEATVEISLRT